MTSLPRFHFDLSQNDVHVNIEPFFSVTEEEVKRNKKNLMMELEWTLDYTSLLEKLKGSSKDRQFQMTMHPTNRCTQTRHIRRRFLLDGTFDEFERERRIKYCNRYVASLPPVRLETITFKRDTKLGRCLVWFGIYSRRIIHYEIKVNLKTKDVALYRYFY